MGQAGPRNRHPFLGQGWGPVSWVCDLCNYTGPWLQKGTMLGLMLCWWCLEISNNFSIRDPMFSLYTGTPKLCSWSCKWGWEPVHK